MKYIATRPVLSGWVPTGSFGDGDDVDLDKAASELDSYTGNVWTHIISLQRRMPSVLAMIMPKRGGICSARTATKLRTPCRFRKTTFAGTPLSTMKATTHVHLMAWSSDPSQGYLTQAGIYSIRSALTNDIFKQEMP